MKDEEGKATAENAKLELLVHLLKNAFSNSVMPKICDVVDREVEYLIKGMEKALVEHLRNDGKPVLDPSVADKIAAHYEHARAKHPYFCDKLFQPEQNEVRSIRVRAITLKGMRVLCTVQKMFQALSAETVLNCELAEVYEAYARGDTANAVDECYDAIAVLLRMVDVLEGRQALGDPAKQDEKKEGDEA